MSNFQAGILSLINSAEQALAVEDTNIELFLQKVSEYLDRLEIFQKTAKAENVSGFKEEVSKLASLHAKINQRVDSCKDKVVNDLSEVGKKSAVLKAYVDHLPSRVTIAGKREG